MNRSAQALTTTEASRAYRHQVLAELRRPGWSHEVEHAARTAIVLLRRERDGALAPSVFGAGRTVLKAVVFALGPLAIATQLQGTRWAWAVAPLVLLSAMAFYGAIAIVHDLAHASFFKSKRLNARVGRLLAPLLLIEFGGFRRSHLDHHRHSQSVSDPKRFGATHSEQANAPDYRTLDHSEPFLRGPVRLGAAVANLPLRLRQVLYLVAGALFVGPAVLLFGGEFSIFKRDWRRAESWISAGQSAAWLAALYLVSPRFLGLFLLGLLGGFAFVFFVFAAHLSPNQVYWTSGRRALLADALNVSDIHCGALLRWLGNGFSDHHSTHHLSPGIACYRLAAAAARVAPLLAPFRAPALDLLEPEDCALLYDNYFWAIVETNAVAWDYTERGALRRLRPAAAPAPLQGSTNGQVP
jgi:fatty acid desaturase